MPDAAVDRRGFVRRALGALGAVFGAVFGIPSLAALADPALKSAAGRWTAAGAAADLKEGVPKRFDYEVKAGWESRKETGFLLKQGQEIVALSARCTHLGCKLRFKREGFHCPCHGGVFSLEGEPVKGPVREPLRRLETRTTKGRVEVRG